MTSEKIYISRADEIQCNIYATQHLHKKHNIEEYLVGSFYILHIDNHQEYYVATISGWHNIEAIGYLNDEIKCDLHETCIKKILNNEKINPQPSPYIAMIITIIIILFIIYLLN